MSRKVNFAKTCVLVAVGLTAAGAAHAAAPKALHTFSGGADGWGPRGGLVEDAAGNLYGTTVTGGTRGQPHCNVDGCGVAFKLAPNGTLTVLHAFTGGASDGSAPQAGLAMDVAGNLYGTTEYGGPGGDCEIPGFGCGTVFKIAPDGTESIVHFFAPGGADGYQPVSGVTLDKWGNLFGTAYGPTGADGGLVYKIAPGGTETILHVFEGAGDGIFPSGTLAVDKSGNIYGTTEQGGLSCPRDGASTCGTVFEIAHGGTESVLYAFKGAFIIGQNDGDWPVGGVTRDAAGNLYGVTRLGGRAGCLTEGSDGCGIIFKLAPGGVETIVHAFAGGSDGQYPMNPPVLTKAGDFVGTTLSGGAGLCGSTGCGIVYSIAPGGAETVISLLARASGAGPMSGLTADHTGRFFGTASYGKDTTKMGTVFAVRP